MITHFVFLLAERLLVVLPCDFFFRADFLLRPSARLTGFSALPARLTSFDVDSDTDSAASPTVFRILATVVFLRPVDDLVELFLVAIAGSSAGNRPDAVDVPKSHGRANILAVRVDREEPNVSGNVIN